MNNFGYFVFVIIAVIIGVTIIKKVTSCLIKGIFLAVIVAVLVILYFTWWG